MRVLFPLDGSDETYRAVERGLALLRPAKGDQVTFLVVVSKALRDMPAEAREHLEFDDEDEIFIRDDEANNVLGRAQALAKKAKFSGSEAVTLVGKVKETIIAESAKHDVLVMHALDLDEAHEHRRGSALEEIARGAQCSVFLVQGR